MIGHTVTVVISGHRNIRQAAGRMQSRGSPPNEQNTVIAALVYVPDTVRRTPDSEVGFAVSIEIRRDENVGSVAPLE